MKANPFKIKRSARVPSKASPDKEAGYSLLEILVVLAIIGTLISVVGPNLLNKADDAKKVAAKSQAKTLRLALDSFALDTGRYPTAQEGLAVLSNPPAGDNGLWAGPYMDGDIPLDPWKNAFIYQPSVILDNGRQSIPKVFSLGADGAVGGEGNNADISS